MMRIVLAGNPNCGKTTLFNALTGENQKVGNWPGVTVERKTGQLTLEQKTVSLIDLPGIYALNCSARASSQDARIASDALTETAYDLILNVVDACMLERHLYLTSQLLELGLPMVVVLTMTDIAEQRGIHIDVNALAQGLGCSVVPIQALKKSGFKALYKALQNTLEPAKPLPIHFPVPLKETIDTIASLLMPAFLLRRKAGEPAVQADDALAYYAALRYVEGDVHVIEHRAPECLSLLPLVPKDSDILAADARYHRVHDIVMRSQKKRSDASEHLTARIDHIVLHRFLALPIFLFMMYAMFVFSINIGGAFQDFFDISTNAIFVQGTAWFLNYLHAPVWLIGLLANGIGQGINTTLTFIPVIAGMFFFLSMLETSGYMARAAFVVDKIMRRLGLPGKAFVPMIVGFGCNVPAIMAARTLDSERDRLLTVLMSPFMSCSARLAIYTVFVAAFFRTGGQNIVFLLYLIGILMAVGTGYVLRRSTFRDNAASLILELPAYHRPSLKRLWHETSRRLRLFIFRAGRMIVPVCVVLGGLNAITIGGGLNTLDANPHSLLSLVSQWITPLFSPMGIDAENWPATVGLLTGMLAKEVVVGTLNALYSQIGQINLEALNHFDLMALLSQACWSVPHNLMALRNALFDPIAASAPDNIVSQSVYGMMASRFDGQIGAFAYMLFILLYIPCVSTIAVIRQEANRRLMLFSVLWSLTVAYAASVGFYQIATFFRHPAQSIAWVLGLGCLLSILIKCLMHYNVGYRGQHVIADS